MPANKSNSLNHRLNTVMIRAVQHISHTCNENGTLRLSSRCYDSHSSIRKENKLSACASFGPKITHSNSRAALHLIISAWICLPECSNDMSSSIWMHILVGACCRWNFCKRNPMKMHLWSEWARINSSHRVTVRSPTKAITQRQN